MDPTTPDAKLIRARNADHDLIEATLSFEYALSNLPTGHPARAEWGRIAHAMVRWAHEARDFLEDQ